jgi:hypothetical protein
MGKQPAKKKADPERIANEIIDEFIQRGEARPSQTLMDWLAGHLDWTSTKLRQHYQARYQELTGNDDDQFGVPPPIRE